MSTSSRFFVGVAALVLILPTISSAQGFNGAITGVVRDSSRAVVPGAAVTVRNMSTDQTVAARPSPDRKASTPFAISPRPGTR